LNAIKDMVGDLPPAPPAAMAPDAPIDCAAANAALEPLSAIQRIRWAVDLRSDNVVLLSSMQKTAMVLMHLFHRLGLANEVLFVDTGYHFVETLKMRDEVMRRYRLNLVTLYPSSTIEDQEKAHGGKLFASLEGQPECCRMRKEEPLLAHLRTKRAPILINGLRRSEGKKRGRIAPFSEDPRTGGHQLAPLFDWTDDDVAAYISEHGLFVHPLHAAGYPSIGCYPCTTPVQSGEDERAGRWRHLRVVGGEAAPQYCRINFSDGGGI
jgi:phosphoadenosine phosphosulfate reductase